MAGYGCCCTDLVVENSEIRDKLIQETTYTDHVEETALLQRTAIKKAAFRIMATSFRT